MARARVRGERGLGVRRHAASAGHDVSWWFGGDGGGDDALAMDVDGEEGGAAAYKKLAPMRGWTRRGISGVVGVRADWKVAAPRVMAEGGGEASAGSKRKRGDRGGGGGGGSGGDGGGGERVDSEVYAAALIRGHKYGVWYQPIQVVL